MASKQELITRVHELTDLTKADSKKAVDAVFDAIAEFLKSDDKVQLIGFGTFEVRERAERKGRNPKTGEELVIPSSKTIGFKAGKALKDAVQK